MSQPSISIACHQTLLGSNGINIIYGHLSVVTGDSDELLNFNSTLTSYLDLFFSMMNVTNNITDATNDDSSLAAGAVAGIVITIVVMTMSMIVVILIVVVFCYNHYKQL